MKDENMETKEYWFSLKSHVYVEFKKEKILLYNTQTGNYIETALEEAISLVLQIYESKNLGVTLLSKEQQSNSAVQNFVQEVLKKQIGDLLEVEKFPQKPIRLVPILNLQKDVDRLKKNKEDSILLGKDILNYLLEVNIYLNDSCSKKCASCKDYCKQIRCCTTSNTKQELSVEDLENIFRQIQFSAVGKVNIFGENIFENKDVLQKLFDSNKDIFHLYLHYQNYQEDEFIDAQNLELIVNFPINKPVLKNVISTINKEKTTFHFIIENEEQYAETEELINQFNIEKYDIQPFFTGKNMDFFSENIFLNKEDIFSKTFQMREIFRNRKLNSNFFGTLFILSDGTVKANMNTQSLGNIRTDTLLNLIYKEMLDNTAWRKVRDSQPCSECIYQFICPAPSDYERAIGKLNLCHIKP
jgi:pseudo-rSAM protein